ncbi:MAG TPA: hypothetical protein VEC36_07935, partial [Patescibacteria group bacterium]|nr:hypothetical protein [Patescibacteria group bacterium]
MNKLYTMIFTALMLSVVAPMATAQSNRFANGTEGTDFWFSFPVSYPEQGGNSSLKIYVACEVSAQCTLEIPGLGLKQVKTTKPGDIIDFILSPGQGQPYESNGMPGSAKSEDESFTDGKGRGIHVYADVPIIVYGVSRYIYTSDSFIALPVSSLGSEYIVASYADLTGGAFSGLHLPSQTVIIAAYDSTEISFTLGGSAGTRTVGG